MFRKRVLPADQGKDGDSKGKQCQEDGRDCQTKRLQTVQKKEQDQTPGGN
jgi:hypothetical protein